MTVERQEIPSLGFPWSNNNDNMEFARLVTVRSSGPHATFEDQLIEKTGRETLIGERKTQ